MLLYVVIAVVLLGVIALLNKKEPQRESLRAMVGHTLAGDDPITPRTRRRYAVAGAGLAVLAAVLWTLFAVGIRLAGWALELAIMSSIAALAGPFWIYVGWLGDRKRRAR